MQKKKKKALKLCRRHGAAYSVQKLESETKGHPLRSIYISTNKAEENC